MSKARSIPAAPFDAERIRREKAGEDWKICRGCGGPLSGRRTSWCSQACVDEYLVRKDPGVARQRVGERDRGICAGCGRDTNALYQFWSRRVWQNYSNESLQPYREVLHEAWCRMFTESLGLGPGSRNRVCVGGAGKAYRKRTWIGGFWDMDHITPVVEGGGGCGLDNLRTLCIPCHRGETAELAKRRAAGRRPQQDLGLEKTG